MTVINNIGSVLLFIIIQPVTIILCKIVKKCVNPNSNRVSKWVVNFCEKKLDQLLWNGIIGFYTESYLFLSFIGWLSLKDQRLSSEHTATEKFSTLLGYLLFAFSFIWPVFVHYFVASKFKADVPALQEQSLDQLRSEGKLGAYLAKYHTLEQRQDYLDKYGGLLSDYRINSKNLTIHQAL